MVVAGMVCYGLSGSGAARLAGTERFRHGKSRLGRAWRGFIKHRKRFSDD